MDLEGASERKTFWGEGTHQEVTTTQVMQAGLALTKY